MGGHLEIQARIRRFVRRRRNPLGGRSRGHAGPRVPGLRPGRGRWSERPAVRRRPEPAHRPDHRRGRSDGLLIHPGQHHRPRTEGHDWYSVR